MSNELERDAQAVSAAVSGTATPNAIHLKRPTRAALWCQIAALAFLGAAVASTIGFIAFLPWPDAEAVALRRIWFLGWIALSGVAGFTLIALSQFFSRIDASAGPGHVALGGAKAAGDDPTAS